MTKLDPAFVAAQQSRLMRMTAAGKPTFVCPDCWAVSPQSDDVKNSYCFNCHAFKAGTELPPRCFEPTCPDFGDPNFGEGTCPSEHAVPPARRG